MSDLPFSGNPRQAVSEKHVVAGCPETHREGFSAPAIWATPPHEPCKKKENSRRVWRRQSPTI